MERSIEKIPTYALCYIVNGDRDNLTEEEVRQIDELYASQHIENIVPIIKDENIGIEPYFCHYPWFGLPCEVCDCEVIYKQYNPNTMKYVKVTFPESQEFMENPRFSECLFVCPTEEHPCENDTYMVPEDLYEQVSVMGINLETIVFEGKSYLTRCAYHKGADSVVCFAEEALETDLFSNGSFKGAQIDEDIYAYVSREALTMMPAREFEKYVNETID